MRLLPQDHGEQGEHEESRTDLSAETGKPGVLPCGNIEWVTDRNKEHVAVPVCKLGLLKPDPENKRNPLGFVRNCEQWEAKYPGEAE